MSLFQAPEKSGVRRLASSLRRMAEGFARSAPLWRGSLRAASRKPNGAVANPRRRRSDHPHLSANAARESTRSPLHDDDGAARRLMALGRDDEALAAAEHFNTREAQSRLLQNLIRCVAGARAQAQLDLHAWRRSPEAPTEGIVVLALLKLQCGDRAEALALLQRQAMETGDATAAQALVLINIELGRIHEAERWMDRLLEFALVSDEIDDVAGFAASLGFDVSEQLRHPPMQIVASLAREMELQESLLASMSRALALSGDVARIWLFIRALDVALPRLRDRRSAIESAARVAIAAGDISVARDWLDRGLNEFPRSAPLALLLAELPPIATRQEAERWPRLTDPATVLRLASEAHPQWPDLRRHAGRLRQLKEAA